MSGSKAINIDEFFDSRTFTPFHWKILLLCLAVLIMDGFDIVAMGFIAPALVADWHISREALGPVMSMSLLGLALGGLLGGPLADRFGRRKVIIGSVFFFGAMSLLSAYSPDLTWLSVFRFLTGLGLGASQPNAATLASEYAPRKYRSLMVTTVYCGFSLGAAGGGFLASHLLATHGWQSILIVGGVVPIVFSFLLLLVLPESAKFLAVKRGGGQALVAILNAVTPGTAERDTTFTAGERAQAKGAIRLILSKPHRLVTLALWTGLFMNILAVYFLNSWLPILVKDEGFTIADAAMVGAMLQVGGIFGNICIGWEMDRCNPHKVMIGTLVAGGLTCLLVANFIPTVASLMVFCFILGFTINATNTGWTALATCYYPTQMRATGTSWMTGVGRFGAIFGVAIGAVLLGLHWTFHQVFLILMLPILLAVLCAYIKGWHKGAPDPVPVEA